MFGNTCSHRLVGKFFTKSTPPSFEETEQSLRKQWLLPVNVTVQKLADDSDTFLFEFTQSKDKEKVLKERPYNVNGVILVIKDPDSSETIDFTVAYFLVVVLGSPFYLRTKENLPVLQSEVGAHFGPVLLGEQVCFEVEVDLKKPLKPGFHVEGFWYAEFKYKNLGDFCYNCGMIDHVKENCDQVKFPKQRDLSWTSTSTTNIYGPWLIFKPLKKSYRTVLIKKSGNGVSECERTLSYAQFFIEIEFNKVAFCNLRSEKTTESTHKFRFPCSYLGTKTDSAYDVLRKEIYENTPFSLGKDEPYIVGSLVDKLKLMRNEYSCDNKWLTLKLQINQVCKLWPIEYETSLATSRDKERERLLKSKILDLIKRRVEENKNLLCLLSWESQIRELLVAMGFALHRMRYLEVSGRAKKAMLEAVRMEISSRNCPRPADRSTFSGLEHFKVLGSDMDRLDPCMICVGEMFLGEEATSLPCSHVFHSSCIEKWLQVGHKCPLCGFKLPTQK